MWGRGRPSGEALRWALNCPVADRPRKALYFGVMKAICQMGPVILATFSFALVMGAQEKSVKPGINDNFLDPALDPAQWVERFEREGREVFDHRDRIVREAAIEPGMVVADIGAGTGLFEPALSRAVGAEGKVIAVDIIPKFLSLIAGKAKARNLHNIGTVLSTSTSTNLKPNSVDLVFICDTYHHFEFPHKTLSSIHQALRPEGQIYLIEFSRIEGKSSEWMLNHVRAGEAVFTGEILEAGFEKVERFDFLSDNYILRFRKK